MPLHSPVVKEITSIFLELRRFSKSLAFVCSCTDKLNLPKSNFTNSNAVTCIIDIENMGGIYQKKKKLRNLGDIDRALRQRNVRMSYWLGAVCHLKSWYRIWKVVAL